MPAPFLKLYRDNRVPPWRARRAACTIGGVYDQRSGGDARLEICERAKLCGDGGTERLRALGVGVFVSQRGFVVQRVALGGSLETCELLEKVGGLGMYDVVKKNELFSARLV